MNGIGQFQEILKQYERHGWTLRRVLLSAPSRVFLPVAPFGKAEVIASDFDAFWFSRRSANGGETWELRSVSALPFALVEVFEDNEEELTREETRRKMETQLRERASKSVAQKRKKTL